MSTFQDLARQVAAAAQDGCSLDEIDAAVIEPSALGGEEKAALWIVAHHEVAAHQELPLEAGAAA